MIYLDDGELREALDIWLREFPLDCAETLEQAKSHRENRFSPKNSMAAGRLIHLGSPVDWVTNPIKDPEFIWLLNRHWHLISLGRAWAMTGDDSFLTTFMDHVRGWRHQNPVNFDCPWEDATFFQRLGPWRLLETGLRAESWLVAWQYFKDCPEVKGAFETEFRTGLAEHADYLCRYLGSADINHAMMHMLGPFYISLFLSDHPRAPWWRQVAMERFELCLWRQVNDEGVQMEMTPGYHNVSASLFVRPWLVARRHGLSFPPAYERRLRQMAAFTEATIRSDGLTTALADWDHDTSSRTTIALLGACLEDDRLISLGIRTPEILWYAGPRAWRHCAGLVDTQKPDPHSRAFPHTGYYVLADQHNHLVFDAASMGGPHGHADCLAFEWSWNGLLLCPDSGRYGYEEGKWRRYFKGTAAHSTITIDGLDQTPYASSQAWGLPVAEASTAHWQSDATLDCIVASHNGYERLDDPVSHQRRLCLLKDLDILIVVDILRAKDRHDYDLRFNLNRPESVECLSRTNQDRCVVHLSDRKSRLVIDQARSDPAINHAEIRTVEGWIAERYSQKEATLALSTSGSFSGTLILATVLHPYLPDPAASAPDPVRIRIDSGLDTVRIGLTGAGAIHEIELHADGPRINPSD